MREGSRTGFRPNRARSQRVQSNSVMSLRAVSSLKGMDGRRLNSERRPTASTVVIALELIEIEAGAYRFDLCLPVADARRSQELF